MSKSIKVPKGSKLETWINGVSDEIEFACDCTGDACIAMEDYVGNIGGDYGADVENGYDADMEIGHCEMPYSPCMIDQEVYFDEENGKHFLKQEMMVKYVFHIPVEDSLI